VFGVEVNDREMNVAQRRGVDISRNNKTRLDCQDVKVPERLEVVPAKSPNFRHVIIVSRRIAFYFTGGIFYILYSSFKRDQNRAIPFELLEPHRVASHSF